MSEPSAPQPERLDSWKAIAAYLQRTERTVRRWEQELGLPIRRVSGERGRSVFAYVSEIDEWLKDTRPDAGNGDASQAPVTLPAPVTPPAPAARWVRHAVTGAASLVVIAGLGWTVTWWSLSAASLELEFTPSAIIARDTEGVVRWRYTFPGNQRGERVDGHPESVELRHAPGTGALAAAGLLVNRSDETVDGGQLFWLTPRGAPQQMFAFDDRLIFGAGEYGAPWGITDFRDDEKGGSGRVAVSAHHYTWWPGVVTVLDERWQREGTFVNAGWIERVHWLSADRLLVGGFSNAMDGGMVAILDADALDGQSPSTSDPQFRCSTCGEDRPVRYVVMRRSELNRAAQARFNRARIELLPDRIVVHTVELMLSETDVIDAVYEFTPSLELIVSSFSTRYWQMHEQLEKEGKVDHTREQCPDRDGPPPIHVWEPSTGWTTANAR